MKLPAQQQTPPALPCSPTGISEPPTRQRTNPGRLPASPVFLSCLRGSKRKLHIHHFLSCFLSKNLNIYHGIMIFLRQVK